MLLVIDGLAEPFVQRALLAGAALAVVAAPLGCLVVWRRMAYVGETLAQACLLGVALALAFQANMMLIVVLAAVAAAGVIGVFGQQKLIALDSALGLMHHGLLALGIIAISLLKGPSIDLMGFLFGDIFTVTWNDVAAIVAGGAIVLAITAALWPSLVRLSVNEDLAAAEGVDPKRARLAFDLLLAVVIAGAMKIVGILLVMAFLVVPAVAARPLSSTPERMAAIAAGIAALGVLAGILLSLATDAPGGPSIVLAMCTFAVISLLAAGRTAG